MFAFTDSWGRVDVAFTDRWGGVSQGSFTELNLAATGRDDPEAVSENLRRVLAGFAGDPEAPVALMHQVHGNAVAVVGADVQPAPAAPGVTGWPEADALVTAEAGVTLVVRVADCVPLLIASAAGHDLGPVAAVHVGRAGLVAGVVPRAVAALRRLGADRLRAWVGPAICGRCYEVPEQMRADVTRVVPEAWAETSWGTPAVDVVAGVQAQLAQEGAEAALVGPCTRESDDLYSHRRDGQGAGRSAGLVRIRGG